MEIGVIGLGRMGENMAVRLLKHGHTAFGADPSEASRKQAEGEGVKVSVSVEEMAKQFTQSPRVFWVMVPAGKITHQVVHQIAAIASPGDIIVDGGNSNYKETLRLHAELKEKNLHYVDCGTSGGVWGLENGYCLMVGGSDEAIGALKPLLDDLAPDNGWAHVGPSGAGHYVKMIHNGIEYGMLQAYAEGFELLHAATEFGLDLHQITQVWNHGSVVRSWLLELAEKAFELEGQDFDGIEDDVADNGTGRWTVEESIERAVPLPVISLALQMRFRTRQDESYAGKAIAALRNQFGGHAILVKHREKVEGQPQPSGGKKDL